MPAQVRASAAAESAPYRRSDLLRTRRARSDGTQGRVRSLLLVHNHVRLSHRCSRWEFVFFFFFFCLAFNVYCSDDRDKLFALIEEKYREVLRINREDTEALREWGLALNDQAEQKEEEEADLLFAKVY